MRYQLNFGKAEIENFSKLNIKIYSVNVLETLLKNVLLCDLMTAFTKFLNIG